MSLDGPSAYEVRAAECAAGLHGWIEKGPLKDTCAFCRIRRTQPKVSVYALSPATWLVTSDGGGEPRMVHAMPLLNGLGFTPEEIAQELRSVAEKIERAAAELRDER